MTITEFLLARIGEDEATARGAAGFENASLTWNVGYSGDTIQPDVAPTVWPYAAEHVARHDPARVLADCEAKRGLVELHDDDHVCVRPDYPVQGDRGETMEYDGLCATTRILAAPWADHPDFDPGWRHAEFRHGS